MGHKPLSEPMLTRHIYAVLGEMSFKYYTYVYVMRNMDILISNVSNVTGDFLSYNVILLPGHYRETNFSLTDPFS